MAVSASFATSSHRSDSRGQVHRSNLHDPSHRAKCKRQWPGFKAHFFAARQLKPKLDSQTRSRRLLFLAEPQRSACRYGGIHRDYRGCAAENFWILDSSFLLRLAKYCLTETRMQYTCVRPDQQPTSLVADCLRYEESAASHLQQVCNCQHSRVPPTDAGSELTSRVKGCHPGLCSLSFQMHGFGQVPGAGKLHFAAEPGARRC